MLFLENSIDDCDVIEECSKTMSQKGFIEGCQRMLYKE